MAKQTRREPNEQAELLRTLLIVQLRLAGFGTRQIRAVVSCETNRVTSVTRHPNLSGAPACGATYPGSLAFNTNTAGGKAILQAALVAYAAGRPVTASGETTCAIYGVVEDWRYGELE